MQSDGRGKFVESGEGGGGEIGLRIERVALNIIPGYCCFTLNKNSFYNVKRDEG